MNPSYLAVILCSVLSISLVACNKSPESDANKASKQKMPLPKVSILPVQFQAIPQYQTFSGRVTAYETTTVMPEINGIVEEVLFREGTMVKKGQPLYRINPDNYVTSVASGESSIRQAQAGLATAKAAEMQAQANYNISIAALKQANSDLARYKKLIKDYAVSEQAYQQAITQQKTAQANVASARALIAQQKANVATAQANIDSAQAKLSSSRLSLGRTIVKAPISGITTRSQVKKGTLVAAGQSSLVTISKLNPIYVDISQPSADMLRLRKSVAEGKAQQGVNLVELMLGDGSIYSNRGKLQLMEAKVDPDTGTMTMRAEFNNQHGVLLPGMYVTARVAQTVIRKAMLLPQSAIMRSAKGETQVYIVDAEKKIQVRPVTLSGTHSGSWIVTDGLQQGEQVVVIGGSRVRPEQEVDTEVYVQSTNNLKQPSNLVGNSNPQKQSSNVIHPPAESSVNSSNPQSDSTSQLNDKAPKSQIKMTKKQERQASQDNNLEKPPMPDSEDATTVDSSNNSEASEVQNSVMLSKPINDGKMKIGNESHKNSVNSVKPDSSNVQKNVKQAKSELEKLESEAISSADKMSEESLSN